MADASGLPALLRHPRGRGELLQPRTLTRDEENIEGETADPDFYYTDAISDTAVGYVEQHLREAADNPFFLYVAYTAPHCPLHAHDDDIAAYKGRFDAGWDVLRAERLGRFRAAGILDESWALSDRDPRVPAWEDTPDHRWEARRMEVYAAQVEAMDRGIGHLVDALAAAGRLDNTLFVYLSDNGGCAEEMPIESARDFVTSFVPLPDSARDGTADRGGQCPGDRARPRDDVRDVRPCLGESLQHAVPRVQFKHWVHQGGISSPFISSGRAD